MSYLLPAGLQANDLVNHMVIRRFAQFNPDSWFAIGPRPSAPFLYTNNWGNVYSLLLPFVILYLWQVRRQARFWPLALLLPVSLVPAVMTLNRGMFLAVGVSLLYVAFRLTLRKDLRGILALVAVAVLAAIALHFYPIQDRLAERLGGDTNSNTDRSSLYGDALALVPESPVFGLGGPQPTFTEVDAPIGTQGQVWLLLVSHGPIATLAFVSFFVLAFLRVRRRHDAAGLACATVLLVGTMELAYYGNVPNGLPILLIAAAIGLREEGSSPT
jgi:O-antigen ligase